MSEKYVLIRPPVLVDEALKVAARKRQIQKVALIERLLTVIVTDQLIDAVLDDGSVGWSGSETTNRLPS